MANFTDYITVDPNVCHGKPVVRGTRIMVWQILDLLGDGLGIKDIITQYFPQLKENEIKACIEYANQLVKNEEVYFAQERK